MDVKNLYREKFEDELPSHMANYNNHLNYSFSNSTEDWIMLDRYCEENTVNYTPLKNSTEFSEVGASNDGIIHH